MGTKPLSPDDTEELTEAVTEALHHPGNEVPSKSSRSNRPIE
jgi:hypothetical protein